PTTRAAQPMGYGFRLTIRHTRRSALYSRPCKYLQTEEHRSWLLAGCSRHSSSHVDQPLFHLVSGLIIEQCQVAPDYWVSFESCCISAWRVACTFKSETGWRGGQMCVGGLCQYW